MLAAVVSWPAKVMVSTCNRFKIQTLFLLGTEPFFNLLSDICIRQNFPIVRNLNDKV